MMEDGPDATDVGSASAEVAMKSAAGAAKAEEQALGRDAAVLERGRARSSGDQTSTAGSQIVERCRVEEVSDGQCSRTDRGEDRAYHRLAHG